MSERRVVVVGAGIAELIATGERPALLEPFRLDRFRGPPLPRRRALRRP